MASILKKIIRNHAMKEDPVEIYGWRSFALTLTACMSGMLFGMDTGIIGGVIVLPAFTAKYHFDGLSPSATATLSANIVSFLQLGCIFGAFLAYPFADKYGRRPSLIVSAIIGLIGIVLQFSASGYLACMYVARLVAGFGCGACSMIAPLYVSENAPRALRGMLTGTFQFFNTFGVMIAFWIDYGVQLHVTGAASYIVPLAMQAVPAVLLIVGMFFLHESPRFLAKQDKWEEAKKVLALVRNLPESHPYLQNEFNDIAIQLERERLLINGASWRALQREMWTIPGNRRRAIISFVLMMFQNTTGSNAINYYSPTIFKDVGITGTSVSLLASGVYGVIKMCSCVAYLVFFADSLGRRRSLLWTAIAIACVMMYVGLYIRISPPKPGATIPAAGYVALVCIYLFAVFFQMGWGATAWIYCAEIPTARLRAMNVSIAAGSQWLWNFVIARATPNMLVNMGSNGYGTYIFFSCCCICSFIFVWFFVPDTKGLSLEQMDDLFGVTQLVEKKAGDTELTTIDDPDRKNDADTRIEKV
ncbi:general substrate transporter [Rhizodiscina lignyota]|uniref:General substrate transporter n=1 Tax=Rhizodiscina lignyota TaxID=1504668 RepID=A0A9P4M6Y7_9PEZI|nr:general substrate transporter [Rhizodiscina lignyota]